MRTLYEWRERIFDGLAEFIVHSMGFCGAEKAISAIACSIVTAPPPPPPTPTEGKVLATSFHTLIRIVATGYARLVEDNVFDYWSGAVKVPVALMNPSFDGWNVVQTTTLVLRKVSKTHELLPLATIESRAMLCAALVFACKSALDFDAFPALGKTQYKKTPLSVIYHLMFEPFVQQWLHDEMKAVLLQKLVECGERMILLALGNDSFRVLNVGPTVRFEHALHKLLCDSLDDLPLEVTDFVDLEHFMVLLRNTAALHVLNILKSNDEALMVIFADCVLHDDYVDALLLIACLSMEAVTHDCASLARALRLRHAMLATVRVRTSALRLLQISLSELQGFEDTSRDRHTGLLVDRATVRAVVRQLQALSWK